MAEDQYLARLPRSSWQNFHGSVTMPIRAMWRITNASLGMRGMAETAKRLQRLISLAVEEGVRLHAFGSRWSFSEIATVRDGWVLQTDQINFDFTVGPNSVDPAFAGDPRDLVFAQAGASIAEINRKIEPSPRKRSFPTSGASNGQTIVGAISTGTHGSAIDAPAMPGLVAGLQLLTATRNLWLEHPDRPTLNAEFAGRLGAELLRDRALFDAALVSLGALGIIHSVLIRVEPRYCLRSFLRRMPLDDILEAMDSLDFSNAGLPLPKRPYFFQAVVDPADTATAFVTTRYKEDCPPDYVPDWSTTSGYEAGNDLPSVMAKLVTAVPPIRPPLVSALMAAELSPFENKIGTPAETYTYTSSRPGSAGAAIGIPAGRTSEALALARQAFASSSYAPAIFAFRYAQATPGTLAFTRFAPTCIMDVDGLDTRATRRLMEAVRVRFDQAGITYTQHWGKLHGLTRARVRAGFGDRVDRWNEARERLLPNPGERQVFSTDLLESVGLHR